MADSKDSKGAAPHHDAPQAAGAAQTPHHYTMTGNDFPPPPGPPPAQQQQYEAPPGQQQYAPPPQQQYDQQQQQPPPQPQQQYAPPPQQQYEQPQQQFAAPPQQPYAQPGQQPTPPGAQGHGVPQPHHTNEQPIPDYDPAHPHLAPPPADAHQGELSDDERRRQRSKGWSTKLHHLGAKAAAPINALANKMGSQAFLPTTMDKECEKAATILLSFCKDGVYSEDQRPKTPTTPNAPEGDRHHKSSSRERAIVTIPRKFLAKAVGLAIFTTARAGFQFSAATGSGLLVARLPDGSWSPPSGIQVHSLGAGFSAGVDIYDCVFIINTKEALNAFMHTRVSLGPDVAIAAGPYGVGGGVDFGAGSGPPQRDRLAAAEAEKKAKAEGSHHAPAEQAAPAAGDDGKLRPDAKKHRRSSSAQFGPVYSYVKSRGFYAGLQVDGTVITERKEANAAFYGEPVPVERILQGAVHPRQEPHLWPNGAKVLMEALKRAEETKRPDETIVVPPATAGQMPASAAPPQAGTSSEQPPGYTNYGQTYPGTGDQKTTYQ